MKSADNLTWLYWAVGLLVAILVWETWRGR